MLKRSPAEEQLKSMIELGDDVAHPRSRAAGLKSMNLLYCVTLEMVLTATAYKEVGNELRAKTVIVPDGFVDAVCAPWVPDYKTMTVLLTFPTGVFGQRNRPERVSTEFCALLKSARVVSRGDGRGYTKLVLQ